MKILTRYILKEMIAPTLLGLAFYTSIIVMRQLFELAGLMIRGSLSVSQVGQLMLFMLPNVVVLTLPMSLLFGILIAVGRLSADSEIIAIRALGSSMRTIYRPVFLFSFALFGVNMYLMNVLLPMGNKAYSSLKAELLTSGIEMQVRPRVFHDGFPNVVLYVDDADPVTGVWKGVFVADSRGPDDQGTTPQEAVDQSSQTGGAPGSFGQAGQRIVAASTGNLSLLTQQDGSKEIWLNLRQAETHQWDSGRPDRYHLSRNDGQRLLLVAGDDSGESIADNIRISRDIKSLSLAELRQRAKETRGKDPYSYKLARVEIQKKFAIPFACLAFGIIGLPLGITNRRGGKSSGFSLSIGIIVLYYAAYTNGEFLAASGAVHPIIGVWAANFILVAIGIWLISRANREIGAQREGGLAQRLFSRFQGGSDASRRNEDGGSILSRLDVTFPNTIDRYVLREFVRTLFLVFLSVFALWLIATYTEMSKDIRENNIPIHTVFAFYRFYLPEILNQTLPISVLVATLVTFGMLSKNNEITAVKASGVSLFRLAVPIVAVAIVLSFVAYLILDFVVPFSNQRADAIKRRIEGKPPISASGQQRLWFRGQGDYIINFLAYDRNAKVLSQITVFEFHPTDFRLARRVSAQRATWNGSAWVFENGWIRSFTDSGQSTFSPITQPLPLQYRETPEQFETEVRPPEQMTFAQLRRYVNMIRKAGYSAEQLDVRLWAKTSWPVISLVMTLIALPFAFRMGKRGALYGIGIALVVGIVYWLIFAVFMKFGEYGNLPPMLAAWAANILFGIAAVYMFLHVET